MRLPKRNKMDRKKKIDFDFEYVYEQEKSAPKPVGFWYSCYNSWYNWTEMNDGMFQEKYIHKININSKVLTDIKNKNKDKLLVINNLKDFDIFNKRYGHEVVFNKGYGHEVVIPWRGSSPCLNLFGVPVPTSSPVKIKSKDKKWKDYFINWDQVSKDYGGIEICPYLKERDHYNWYSGFDVASGCIWNTKAIIKNSELIYEEKKGKYVKTNS